MTGPLFYLLARAERTMRKNSCRWLRHVALILSASIVQGCGNGSSKPAVDKAEAVVETFLDAWSRGESSDKFADPDQPIHGADPDWKAGYRLLSFLTVDSTPSQEAPHSFRCRVALSLKDRQGRKVEKEVVYGVQLGEKCVIRRASR